MRKKNVEGIAIKHDGQLPRLSDEVLALKKKANVRDDRLMARWRQHVRRILGGEQ